MGDKYGKGAARRGTIYCSFCGRAEHEVQKLIAGPCVFICDECTLLCAEIIATKFPDFRLRMEAALKRAFQEELEGAVKAAITESKGDNP